jgi:DNA polymerase-3 subunit beta
MTASINIATLKAVNLAASTEETRFYLKGVYVEVTDKTVTYTATNGHILLSLREDSLEPNTLIGAWIIPSDFIKAAKPNKHTDIATMTTVSGPNDGTRLAFDGTITGMVAPIDGSFPDYRRILPATVDGKPGQYDGNYTAVMAKFAKALGLGYAHVHHNGDGPAPVTFNSQQGVFGIIMPLRANASTETPAWDSTIAMLSPDETEAAAQAAHAAKEAIAA